MKFVFSKHSLEQMQLRSISKRAVENILEHPEQVKRENGKTIYQSVVSSSGKKYLIRIFVNHRKNPNVIITVYRTSKISKYHEGKI